jgi:hypothetical protein
LNLVVPKYQPQEPAAPTRCEPSKKAYERPRILFREPLEVAAVLCGNSGGKGDPFLCPAGPINS